jgi:DNA polymerase-1
MEDSEKTWIFQNALFDLKFLYLKGIYPRKIYDTFIAEGCIKLGYKRGTYSRSLLNMAQNYLGVSLDKEIRGEIHWRGFDDSVIVYAANDVKYLGKIKEKQLEIIEQENIQNIVDLENDYVRVLTYLTLSGIKIDVVEWKKRCIEEIKKLKSLEETLHNFITDNADKYFKYVDHQLDLFSDTLKCKLNFNSSKQVIELFLDLGLNLLVPDDKTGKMKYSVESTVLTPQVKIDPIIQLYTDYKSQEKIVSTYGENWLNHIHPVTGRIHTQYTQMMDTGRLSSGGKDKSTNQEFINFLNIPQDNSIRNCIIPEKDKVFVDCDYTGQETYIFAEFSGEESMIDFLNNDGGDMHSFIASKIYPELAELSLDEIKDKHKAKRQNAKAAGFAIAYGGVGATISKNLSIPIEEGNYVYDSYFKVFPNVKRYFDTCKNLVLNLGYIVTNSVTERRIHFSDFDQFKEKEKVFTKRYWEIYREEKAKDSKLFQKLKTEVKEYFKLRGKYERSSYNFPIQSTGADMIKIAAIDIFNHILEKDAMFKVLFPFQIHDQIILEAPEDEADYWAKIVSTKMVEAGNIFCKKVQIKAVPEILTKWKK